MRKLDILRPEAEREPEEEFEEADLPPLFDAEALTRLKTSLRAKAASAPALAEPPESEDDGSLPKVLGHQLTPREWATFEAYVRTGTLQKAADETGISYYCLRKYRRSAWWNDLFDTFIKERQQDLHAGLVGLTQEAIDATQRVLTGKLANNADNSGEARYAPAIINAVNLLTKIGKAPLQDGRNITNIDNRSLINTGPVHISRERLETLDQDDMLKMITGEVKIE